MGFFSGKSSTVTQQPLLTEEQKESQKLLLQVGRGELPGFDTSNFNFDRSQVEGLGENRLLQRITGGAPKALSRSEDILSKIANQDFTLDDETSGLGAFKRRLAREISDSDDILNRESAITGGRVGSRILGEKTDLAERQSDIISSRLADLFQRGQDRSLSAKLSAASGLADIGRTQEGIESGRLREAFSFGDLERSLKNQQAQTKLNEFNRARNERLQNLNNLFQRNVDFGVLSSTAKSASPFSKLLNAGIIAAGTAIGGPAGGAIAAGITGSLK